MKIGTPETETPNAELPSAGLLDDMIQETPQRSILTVMDEAAATASASTEVVEPTFVFDEKAKKFFSGYRIARSDLGRTPLEIMRESGDELLEPSKYEEEILDALIFRGHYQREFTIGRMPFILTTYSSETEQNSRRMLQKAAVDDPTGFSATFNAVSVARCLVSVGVNPACEAKPGSPEWDSNASLAARLKFVMGLSIPVIDAIGMSVNAFVAQTSAAVNRNLSSF
jgi:hypothetical protein